jgi:glycosyltransferase involved in cell wall biosynthesis
VIRREDRPPAGAAAPRRHNRIRLLKFLSEFYAAGTEGQVVNLVERLDPARFDVRFACFERAGQLLPALEQRGVPVTEYRIKRLYGARTLRKQWRLAGEIRRHGVQIVHSYNLHGNVFTIPAARLARAAVTIASIRSLGDVFTPMQWRVQRQVCRFADCVLANSDAIRRSLIADGYDADKIAVIRNGLDLDRLTCTPGGGERVRAQLGLRDKAPLVAVLARVSPIKGLEYFLEAIVPLARRFPDARFAVVGAWHKLSDGRGGVRDYQAELQTLATRLGLDDRLVFSGVREDVADVLSQTTVSVLPSLSEGLPNAVLESMAAGVPVVASRVGGVPEAVEDGSTGLLVPPRDAAALANAIGTLLEHRALARRFGDAGRQRVMRHFRLERVVRETEELYVELLARARRRRPAHIHNGKAL